MNCKAHMTGGDDTRSERHEQQLGRVRMEFRGKGPFGERMLFLSQI